MNSETYRTYLMNNIPRGTSAETLLCSIAQHWRIHDGSFQYGLLLQSLIREPVIHDSKLDSDLSVATIEFKDPPRWFKELDRDPDGFPKKSQLGVIWRGVDLSSLDADNRNEFTRAVIAGDIVYAETIAEFEQTNINSQAKFGRTALHWACVANHVEMIAFCLSLPVIDTTLIDVDGLTAFDLSTCHEDEHEVVPNLFYQCMFERERSDPDGALLQLLKLSSEPELDGAIFPGEALFRPVVLNNLPLVAALMEVGVQLTARNEDQETALHMAAKEGHTDMVKMLVQNSSRGERFDVNTVAQDGLTPLHYAAVHGHEQVLRVLMGHGADKAVKDAAGRTALNRATENHHIHIQAILHSNEDSIAPENGLTTVEYDSISDEHSISDEDPVAGEANSFAGVSQRESENYNNAGVGSNSMAQNKSPSLESIDRERGTVLLDAARAGNEKRVTMLLDQGADIDYKDVIGKTPLHGAIRSRDQGTVLVLLNRGADIEAKDNCGDRPLHRAAMGSGKRGIGQILLDHGADIEAKDRYGYTPLHLAAGWGSLGTVRILIDRGADIEANNDTGRRPLHAAAGATSSNGGIVQILLDRGADIEAKTVYDETPLHVAVGGHKKTLRVLLDRGANIEAKDNIGRTPLLKATECGRVWAVYVPLENGADPQVTNRDGRAVEYLVWEMKSWRVNMAIRSYWTAQRARAKEARAQV